MDELTKITRIEGGRHDEFSFDSSHRAYRGLGGRAGHEGTNLIGGLIV